jgi:hypothetical protein
MMPAGERGATTSSQSGSIDGSRFTLAFLTVEAHV